MSKKNSWTRRAYRLGEPPADPGDLAGCEAKLVDRRSGVVRSLRALTKDPSEPEQPYVFRAELANSRFQSDRPAMFTICSGKGATPEGARLSALGEAVERYCAGLAAPGEVVRGRRGALPGISLDPRRLVLYRPELYAQLKYAPWDEDEEHGWVRGRALLADQDIFVPALAALMSHDVARRPEFLFPATSNGLAAGPTRAEAILRAACEVIERDAFLSAWMLRLPCRRVDPAAHPEPATRDIVAAYARRGVEFELYRLPTDTSVHAFLALAVNQGRSDGPTAVVGLGAAHDAASAARGAILEVGQVRPALRVRMREAGMAERIARLVADPFAVATLEDHDLRYAAPETLGAFDFLRRRPVEPFDWRPAAPADAATLVRALAEELGTLGTDLLAIDLSTPDLAQFGLHVARAVIPDFQPIHFGHGEPRLGGVRLFETPRRFGLGTEPAGLADLNPDPHPLA